MVSIKIVNEETGNAVYYSKVVIYCGGNYEKYTDSNGIAHFEHIFSGSYTVYIDGKDQGIVYLSGISVFYI